MPLCGGNIDTTVLGRVIAPNPDPTLSLTPAPPLTKVLGRVIERGLAADGRLVRLVASVSDRPGGIATWSKCPLGSAPARLLCILRAYLAALGSSAPPEKGLAY